MKKLYQKFIVLYWKLDIKYKVSISLFAKFAYTPGKSEVTLLQLALDPCKMPIKYLNVTPFSVDNSFTRGAPESPLQETLPPF